MANTTEYKGFTVAEQDGRFYVANVMSTMGVFTVKAGFKPEGYATLNNAKGAITKRIAAMELNAAVDAGMAGDKGAFPWAKRAAKAADKATITAEDADIVGGIQMLTGEADKPEGYTHPGKFWPFPVIVLADSYKVTHDKPVDLSRPLKGSRNKREGRYAGKHAEYVGDKFGRPDRATKIKARHWRVGPAGLYDDLRSHARFMAKINAA